MRPAKHQRTLAHNIVRFACALLLCAIIKQPAWADATPTAAFVDDQGAALGGDDLKPSSSRGDIQLSWALVGEHPADAPTPVFRLVGRLGGELIDEPVVYYTGTQPGTFISGLEEGTHEFVVAARFSDDDPWGPESEPILFAVEHHSLVQTFLLLGIGAFLFVAIVFVVVREAITAKDPFADDDNKDDTDDDRNDETPARPAAGMEGGA